MKLVKIVAMGVGAVGGWMAAGAMMQSGGGGSGTQPAEPPAVVEEKPVAEEPSEKKEEESVLDFTMNLIDGTPQDLAEYKGKVVVIVNVASKCGFTKQYAALEALYKEHKEEGLVILGFPADDFKNQEPGSNEEIAAFCQANYGVTFPLFEKISVKGDDQHALYTRLAGLPSPLGGEPKWNFTKFVLDREGKVVERVDAAGEEGDRSKLEKKLVEAVEGLLKKGA